MVRKKIESSERFNKRIENYSKYRPDYPVEVIAYLNSQGLLSVDSTVADIGSGTNRYQSVLLGHLTKPLRCLVHLCEKDISNIY